MRRFLQVAFGILAANLLLATELRGQHGPASVSSGHIGGAFHPGPSPSFSGSSRRFASPSGSLFTSSSGSALRRQNLAPRMAGPAPRYPSFGRGQPDNGRGGVGYRRRYPYIYGGYVGLGPFGYGLPLP